MRDPINTRIIIAGRCDLCDAREAHLEHAKRVYEAAIADTEHAIRERDQVREKAQALAKAVEDLPCYFCWRDRREGKLRVACDNYTTEDGDLPEAAWCPSCKARAALAAWRKG